MKSAAADTLRFQHKCQQHVNHVLRQKFYK